ncbi:MAG: IPT/TIG domain-containing protein [Candidatus Wallbacteria bacterium]|nr:IPT/TIG domain-containing protein [Candidatus Wallbacteria bacterium]
MRGLVVTAALLLVAAGRAPAQFVRLELGSGANLVSLPAGAVATAAYRASDLVRDTGATAILVPGTSPPVLYVPGIAPRNFELPAGKAVLVLTGARRRAVLRVATGPLSPFPRARIEPATGLRLVPVGLPLFAGARARPGSAELAAATSATAVIRTAIDPADGRARFETHAPATGGTGFPLEPGAGYLLSVPPGATTTTLELYADLNSDGLPDSAPALSGGSAGDADGDGLANLLELALGTDPARAQTDGDGVHDGYELLRGTDPFDAAQRPPPPRVTALSVTELPAAQGGSLTLDGEGFEGFLVVQLTDPASSFLNAATLVSPTRIFGQVPAGLAPGTYDLRVTTPAGTSGTSSARLTLRSADPAFAANVYPIFRRRCISCHGPGSGNGQWAASSAAESFSAIQNRGVVAVEDPEASLLLAKPSGRVRMSSGVIIFSSTSDPDYQTILRWIRAGAPNN